MKKLIIKNSEWLRGGMSYLFDSGSRCYCVQGILCKQTGVSDDDMDCCINVELLDKVPEGAEWLLDATVSSKIAVINDDTYTTDAEKIAALKPIFAEHGVEIEYREDE